MNVHNYKYTYVLDVLIIISTVTILQMSRSNRMKQIILILVTGIILCCLCPQVMRIKITDSYS